VLRGAPVADNPSIPSQFFPEIRVKHILPQANVIATLSQYGQEYEDTVIEAEGAALR